MVTLWLYKLLPDQPSADSPACSQGWSLKPITHCSRNSVGPSLSPPPFFSGSSHHCYHYYSLETGSHVSFGTPFMIMTDLNWSFCLYFSSIGMTGLCHLALLGVLSILFIGTSQPQGPASVTHIKHLWFWFNFPTSFSPTEAHQKAARTKGGRCGQGWGVGDMTRECVAWKYSNNLHVLSVHQTTKSKANCSWLVKLRSAWKERAAWGQGLRDMWRTCPLIDEPCFMCDLFGALAPFLRHSPALAVGLLQQLFINQPDLLVWSRNPGQSW